MVDARASDAPEPVVRNALRTLFWLTLAGSVVSLLSSGPFVLLIPQLASTGPFATALLGLVINVLAIVTFAEIARQRGARRFWVALGLMVAPNALWLLNLGLRFAGFPLLDLPLGSLRLANPLSLTQSLLAAAANIALWLALATLVPRYPPRWMTVVFSIGAVTMALGGSGIFYGLALVALGPLVFALYPLWLVPPVLMLVLLRKLGWRSPELG